MTNLNWIVDESELAQAGIPVRSTTSTFKRWALLSPNDYRSRLRRPADWRWCRYWTWAILIRHQDDWVVIPGEGGHKRFAPKNDGKLSCENPACSMARTCERGAGGEWSWFG